MTRLAVLIFLIAAASPLAARDCATLQGRTPEETAQLQAQCAGWEFRTEASRVARTEPYLHSDARFAAFQGWTLANQLTIQGHLPDLQRIFVVPPASVREDQLEKTYLQFATTYTRIQSELPEHLALHRSMFTDATHDVEYMRKFDLTVRTLSDGQGGFQPFDCDYIAQPLNAIWFSLQSAKLLDAYGTTLWGAEWAARRDRLLADHGLKTPAEIEAWSAAGFPYVPAPQFAAAPAHPDAPVVTPLLGVGERN